MVHYYDNKEHHLSLRKSSLDTLAEAWAEKNNVNKSSMIKTLKKREEQRSTARKIKLIWGKLEHGSTTVVTIKNQDGTSSDITEKHAMELAIMEANENKYKQSFHTPFMIPPLDQHVGYRGLTNSAQQVLEGK
jgi:hypothetical protein